MAMTSENGTVYELHGAVAAPVVTLVHGLGLTRATWEGLVPVLSGSYRILNYDLYGHGDSSQSVTITSLSVFADQLRELLDELNIDKTAVVGFSLGGMINRRFAIDYPQRTSALGIFNSPHEREVAAQRQIEERARQSEDSGPGANLDTTIKRWFTSDFIDQNPDFIDRIRGWVLANNPVCYAQSRMVLAAGVTELIRPDPRLEIPSLIMTCENDTGSTPAMSHAIASEIPGSEVQIVPMLQHMGLTQQPMLFADPLLSFLHKVL